MRRACNDSTYYRRNKTKCDEKADARRKKAGIICEVYQEEIYVEYDRNTEGKSKSEIEKLMEI